jgi:ribonuclease P protein component
MATEYSLGKEERLKSNFSIQELLRNGRTVSGYPLKVYWDFTDDLRQEFPARMAVSVPKKKFRRAVDRNLIKRRIRESYRLNKNIIYEPLQERKLKIALVILFLSEEFVSFDELNKSISGLLERISGKLTP